MKNYVVFTEESFKERVKMGIKLWEDEFGLSGMENLPMVISPMESMFGYFQCRRINGELKSKKLQFSINLLNGKYTIESVDDIILHEICHYLLFEKTKERHGHDRVFYKYCAIVGCNAQSSGRPKLSELGVKMKAEKVYKYVLTCDGCGQEHGHDRKVKSVKYPHLYRCKCGGGLKLTKNG